MQGGFRISQTPAAFWRWLLPAITFTIASLRADVELLVEHQSNSGWESATSDEPGGIKHPAGIGFREVIQPRRRCLCHQFRPLDPMLIKAVTQLRPPLSQQRVKHLSVLGVGLALHLKRYGTERSRTTFNRAEKDPAGVLPRRVLFRSARMICRM